MRLEDAPPPGWYPDPEGTSRLRYWEGTDWTDRFRPRPIETYTAELPVVGSAQEGSHRWVPDATGLNNPGVNTQAVVDQVRMAARAEAERAADLFSARARAASREIEPLISQYTSRIMRWFRIASVLAIVLLIGWVIWQVFVQVSLFDWIGDRIDNLTDDTSDQPVQGIILSWFW